MADGIRSRGMRVEILFRVGAWLVALSQAGGSNWMEIRFGPLIEEGLEREQWYRIA